MEEKKMISPEELNLKAKDIIKRYPDCLAPYTERKND